MTVECVMVPESTQASAEYVMEVGNINEMPSHVFVVMVREKETERSAIVVMVQANLNRQLRSAGRVTEQASIRQPVGNVVVQAALRWNVGNAGDQAGIGFLSNEKHFEK